MIARLETESGTDYLWFYCGGCKTHHCVPVTNPARWAWNGSTDKPTLTPSILVTYDMGEDHTPNRCHSFVTNGEIQYLSDCTHALAGQTVPLEEMP